MPCWVIIFMKIYGVPVRLKAIWTINTEFFSSEVRYRRANSSRFSLCFIVKLWRWIIFLCLIFSLFKCILIVLVLQGACSIYFNIFDVDEVFFFCFVNNSSLELWWYFFRSASQFSCSILFGAFQGIAYIRYYCVLKPLKFLWDFPILFRAVILLSWNSDNLVPLAIPAFSILRMTVLIAFKLYRLYKIHFSMRWNSLFFSFYWWSNIFIKNKF